MSIPDHDQISAAILTALRERVLLRQHCQYLQERCNATLDRARRAEAHVAELLSRFPLTVPTEPAPPPDASCEGEWFLLSEGLP